ncbi:hypothetical protein Tsubulata_023601 [Turnera subulata]|uniref:SANT domain-containing protein n=1 Tax=Turnera subulata TaxID=218843 RepID=A0A9Q0G057_9ROSI|nr:hypothetical protein Tsubulata_023601 [Turnera subulata]
MAPTRKKSVNKRFPSEVSPEKEVKKSNKSKQQKKKLSDKLGPKWSEVELHRFYRAYRDYGKDWKKVAAKVRHRSVEMVEALYNMNRAYLSLPEGTASVLGLIAMMTDYYSILGPSDNERESNELPGLTGKLQKRKRAKIHLGSSEEEVQQPHSLVSADGCLSLLKRASLTGGQPRAVGKRTPRFPISHANKKAEVDAYYPPRKKSRISDVDANDDDVAHVAALLAQASQQGGSPKVSSTLKRKPENIKSSPVQSCNEAADSSLPKHHAASMYRRLSEGGVAVRKPDTNGHTKRSSSVMDIEDLDNLDINWKGKKSHQKKYDDDGEACSATEERSTRGLKGNADSRFQSNAKLDGSSPQSERKRSKELISGADFHALDPLHTLAHVFLMDSESSARLNEETDGKSSTHEGTSASHCTDKAKISKQKEKTHHATSEVEGTATRKFKSGKYPATYGKHVPEVTEQPQPTNNNIPTRKRPLLQKLNTETLAGSRPSKPPASETLDEMENVAAIKGKRGGHISTPPKQLKSTGVSEVSSFSSDEKSTAKTVAESTAQVPVPSQIMSTTKKGSRRKMELKRALALKSEKSSEKNLKNQKYSDPMQDGVPYLKERLSCCLSSYMVQRWCIFEWFYSAIDYPWFAKREFVEYLNHVGLGHIPRLARVEWGVIRSSLGKPRRFSDRFLHEEREKLQQYRESVREHYTELRTGVREGLPTDLARPLSVGQRVIAIHPKTRELLDGSVLTVDHDRCRVQFNHPDMGVEFVKDIDCMPLNPLDNMPEALRRHRFSTTSNELQGYGQLNTVGFSSSEHLQHAPYPPNTLVKQTQVDINRARSQAKLAPVDVVNPPQLAHVQSSGIEHTQAKESYAQALSELIPSKDKQDPSTLLNHLRQRNAYQGNRIPPWLSHAAHSNLSGGLPRADDVSHVSLEPGSTVLEIIRGSRSKAHTMVDAAVQAISSIKDGDDAYMKIGEALDSIDKRRLPSDSRRQVIKSQEYASGISHRPNHLISNTSDPQGNKNLSGPMSHDDSNKIEAAIPSELISSCVATLLMIQSCTERHHSPNDVAQIIDYAVSSLHPCCPQNLPIYREIQMCMGRIKTQILGLIPTK